MSFMERRISEYKTAPDVRRVKQGEKRRTSHHVLGRAGASKTTLSGIPVLERKKMFEQTDSSIVTSGSFGAASGRRASKQRKEIGRNSSFRGTKRLRSEDSHSPVLGRSKQQLGSPNVSLPVWKKLRNFGHFDLQSLAIHHFAISAGDGAEHNVKKPTGASAAHGSGDDDDADSSGQSNSLVACCSAFTNEIGGDGDWLTQGNPVLLLRDSLSVEKQRRVGSRERLILDGEIPLKSMVQSRGPMNRQVSDVLLPKTGIGYPFEFIDFGASYYRNYFLHNEHQNFFGVDENLGPIAISIKREKVPDQLGDFYSIQPNVGQLPPKHLYRVIFRTSELSTLRGTVLEDSIPTGAKTGTSKGIPPRDIVEYISQGEVQISCLKLGKMEKKVLQELVRLDEQELNNKYKVGIIYCKAGQETEEEMYNNESGSPAFDEFLELMGEKVRMKGFNKYRAQLDNKTDTTGEYSVYTEFKDTEVMFHVSTLLPHTASNKQQLLRKRHIGNDIVTIIFQEPDCPQFSPRWIRSHFQHIFIIVRAENPNSKFTKYRVAVSRSTDIPFFGPVIPEKALFDKNENFRDFLLTKVINACNASLRNQKFSAMATRTRKQYLNDLAEHSCTTTTIDQANTSGRVAGLLRFGHKKKECMRQESTLVYTGGALSWHVSIIFREKNPLPFSEEHDDRIECIMGIGPDIVVFLDYHTKNTLLHVPTKDLSGWIIDGTRMNLFYDNTHCLSLDCHDSEDEVREMVARMQAVAPRLSTSHEATLMEFRRSSTGFLGFTINEAGVVERVDGLAKISGLQPNSRLLQVEDRLLCCHSHKQITDLLTAREKVLVRAYVIPPPPKGRHPFFYPEVNWTALWASRPSHMENEESTKVQNGVESSEKSEKIVELRKKKTHVRSHSHTNRLSYMEAVQSGDMGNNSSRPDQLIIDDDEPIYDRLRERVGSMASVKPPRSPTQPQRRQHLESISYRRVKGPSRATRESVLHLADDMMERGFTQSLNDPQPMEHTVSEVDITSPIQLTTSVQLPDHKPHTAAPLAPRHRRSNSRELKKESQLQRRPTIEVSSPLTPKGNVSRITKKFSFQPSTPPSRIPGPAASRHGSSPLKATASASEMTKSNIPVKSSSNVPAESKNETEAKVTVSNVPLRSGGNRRYNKARPASFDVALLLNNEKNVIETSRDDSTLHRRDDASFNRNTQVRTAFRRRSQSRELSPEAEGEDDVKAKPAMEHVPRSPTTGALISANESEMFLSSEEIPEYNEMQALGLEESEKKLSQNTGSQSSQDSIRDLKLTVRERTQRWEARGGGVPSYFSTLPKSFRHKATDRRRDPAYTYAPQEMDEEEMMAMQSYRTSVSSRSSVSGSGIPVPTSKHTRPPRGRYSVPSTPVGTGGSLASAHLDQSSRSEKSLSPTRGLDNEHRLNSSGQSSNESSLERGRETGQDGGGKVRGKGSMLPKKSTSSIQVSSKRTGQPMARSHEDEVFSPPSESGTSDHTKPRSTSEPSKRSGIPVKSTKPPPEDPSQDQDLQRHVSTDSLEENFLELDRNLNDLLKKDDRRERALRNGSAHVEEWLKQTSKDAIVPEMLGESLDVVPPQPPLSPTFTENSTSFSQTSDYSQEMIDSLKSKVEMLEAKLDKESECNHDLRGKLKLAEQRLHEAEVKRNQKLSATAK